MQLQNTFNILFLLVRRYHHQLLLVVVAVEAVAERPEMDDAPLAAKVEVPSSQQFNN